MKQQVFNFLLTIPRGKVVTYGQIAAQLGCPRSARVVGNILHHNPDPERYPCYKVVNHEGRLSPNFAFGGDTIQEQLLELEGIEVIHHHVNLAIYQWRPNPKKPNPGGKT